MIGKHKSSVTTFIGIYLTLTLILGISMFALYRSHRSAVGKAELNQSLLTSTDRVIPQPGKSIAPPNETPPVAEAIEKTPATVKQPVKTKKQSSPRPSPDPPEEEPSSPENQALIAEIEKQFPLPQIKPLHEIIGNWKAVPKRAFPSFVTIRKPVDFKIRQNGTVVAEGKLPAGSSMIPTQLQGETLFLSSSRIADMSISLPVSDTDFRERIEKKYDAFVERQKREVAARRKAELERRLKKTAHEVEMTEFNDGEDPRFDPLKASIRRGEAGFFQIESAAKWRWAGVESHEGEEFQTAYVLMVQESVFGTTERELKALIKNGEVHSWIDLTTGQKI